ncbi:hypothetical protein TTHERM_000973000 (macronuclear) [Tetrahymena thermophila SB210]|uniref:Uncharacterized protein n=1 Tax=Tetrahymena thermophila (strain SB210) TaxID=312017 RepID=W7X939_TETTS|nr:hypothetical protein TTHERM_000973000 [Tetrahymena thermophila SB210]EWS75915.1 hypothetical protein TTHERM_000973000 [Tetrahymena thermophila SB210]|eukprot:XP_012651540.1 hypothetical protein TTHERM_000973000 [Tetrahymena thermophila SB210]
MKVISGYAYDYNEKNLYIYGSSIYVINAQLTPQKIVDQNGDYIQMNYMTLIDRQSFDFIQFDIRDSSGYIIQFIYIEQLNYILFNTSGSQDQISLYDVSAQQKIVTLSGVKYNSLDNKNIIQVEYDESSIRYVMFLDAEGTFYLSSIDPKLPFQSFVKISEFTDGQEKIQKFSYDNITNDVFIYSDQQIYKFDYNLLGNQYEPILNEPQSLFVQISINSMQTDFLIINKFNVIQRYTEQKKQQPNFYYLQA